tara:strand:- start:11918 stop:13486 length:1569 start_codon:yes stop_codon:yes gene_type:complete
MSESDSEHNYNTRSKNGIHKKPSTSRAKYFSDLTNLETTTPELFRVIINDNLITNLVHEANSTLDAKTKTKSKKNLFEFTISNLDAIIKNSQITDEDDEDYKPIVKIRKNKYKQYNYTKEDTAYLETQTDELRTQILEKEETLRLTHTNKKPLRFKILNMKHLTDESKNNILTKLAQFNKLDPTDNEYHKLSTWLQWLDKVPFDTNFNLTINNTSANRDIVKFLKDSKETLDSAVYGHEDAKFEIINILAKLISNNDAKGACIAIQGPMGNGKTTLVKEGICKALGRPFGFSALGGMQDASYLLGHDYTYEGSRPGRILELLTESGCMNPVLYFDELDKISDTPRGEEIANLLCHMTDTAQNTEFQDKYLSGVKIDLSKVIFIFSYNDVSKINPILLDRMIKINTAGFNVSDKINIASNYLIPEVLKEYAFAPDEIIFPPEIIKELINNYIPTEKGVRNLKRVLHTIIGKINVMKYIDTMNSDIVQFKIKDFKLPIQITQHLLNNFIKPRHDNDMSLYGLYS